MSDKPITIAPTITVVELANRLGCKVTDLIAELMKNGIMATINDTIDYETAAIVAGDLGYEVSQAVAAEETKGLDSKTSLSGQKTVVRPPIVSIMGHVDHGKTTLLDAIRESNITATEAGGITQHIGAYQVTHNGRKITFIDTPGHEAFSVLRQHGAKLTDIAIIVVAADDGVKPQTREAIDFAKAAKVEIIVAINKIDKPGANINKVKQELNDIELVPEEWGGKIVTVEISAKQKTNLDQLLNMVLLVAEVHEIKARASGPAEGTVIEARMVTGKGAVASLLVEHGELKAGDFVVAAGAYGKVRTLETDQGKKITFAEPGQPVLVSGWKSLPAMGDRFYVVENERVAKQRTALQSNISRHQVTVKKITEATAMTEAIERDKIANVNLVVKADVQGSLESLNQSLSSLNTDEVQIKIVSQGLGNITESDVQTAESSTATIIGFNVILPSHIKQLAERSKVKAKLYKVIYELLDDARMAMSALLKPEVVEEIAGQLEIKGVFKVSRSQLICGGQVTSGKITSGLLIRIPDGAEIGKVKSVQKEKQVVKEVVEGEMCGLEIDTAKKTTLDIGQSLEFFSRETRERTL